MTGGGSLVLLAVPLLRDKILEEMAAAAARWGAALLGSG